MRFYHKLEQQQQQQQQLSLPLTAAGCMLHVACNSNSR
jgi:hypothetical protein